MLAAVYQCPKQERKTRKMNFNNIKIVKFPQINCFKYIIANGIINYSFQIEILLWFAAGSDPVSFL